MVTENLDLYEIIFRLIGGFLEHVEHLSLLPLGQYLALGFGTLVVFAKKYLIPKRLMFRKNSGKNKK